MQIHRLAEVQKELAHLEDTLQPLQLRYEAERQRLDEIRRLQEKRDQLLVNIEIAETRNDLARIADLKYGALPDVDARLKALREQVRVHTHTHTVTQRRLSWPIVLHVLLLGVPPRSALFSSASCQVTFSSGFARGRVLLGDCTNVIALPSTTLSMHMLTLCLCVRTCVSSQAPKDAMLTETVGPEEIAQVVSRWTGIPVAKLQQTEKDKLLHLKDELHK